jgi:hypothetical protein
MRIRRALSALVVLLLLGDGGALLSNGDGQRTRSPLTTSTTAHDSTIAPPPAAAPQRILIAHLNRMTLDPVGLMSVLPDGSGLQDVAQPVLHPEKEMWHEGGLVAYSVLIASRIREGTPVCSPVECTIAYTVASRAIAVANLDGSNEHFVSVGPGDVAPAFSRLGDIAFLGHHCCLPNHAVVIDSTGRLISDFAPAAGEAFSGPPSWSPDGTELAVGSAKVGGDVTAGGIDIIPLNGGPRRRIARGAFREVAWSHDGRAFVATHDRTYDPKGGPQLSLHRTGDDLWLVPIDGVPMQLTHLAPAKPLTGPCGNNPVNPEIRSPVWSIDDQEVAFLNPYAHPESLGIVTDVYVINRDGSGLHAVYRQPTACPTRENMGEGRLALFGWTR